MANFNSPEGDIAQIYLSDTEILERYVGNQLWLWGLNSAGQLGTNDIVHRSSPVQTVSGSTNWKQVSVTDSHTAAIKTDGTLWLWGQASNGRLGTNSSGLVHRSSPVQTVSGGTNWKQVSAGGSHTAAIKTDGTLWLWGNNRDDGDQPGGQLGENYTAITKSSPVQTVAGGTNWKQVSAGGYHTAAIKTDGTLWLWGDGLSGRLGDDSAESRSSPVQTIAGGTNWKEVSAGTYHTAAIKIDGTLWLWGRNNSGYLGIDDTANRSSPVQTISGGTNWKQVSAGSDHTAAIKTDGTLWVWGSGLYGKLGTDDIVNRSSPVQTVSGGTNWKQVSAGTFLTAAIKTDGTLWLWGGSGSGGLGTDDIVARSSPVQTIAGGNNWKQVSGGTSYTAAVTYTES